MNKQRFDITLFIIVSLLLTIGLLLGITTATQMKQVYIEKSEQCNGIRIEEMTLTKLTGMSMQPTMFDGEKALLAPYNKTRRIVSGDIVSVRIGEKKNRLHRVVAAYKDYFLMKGDNNDAIDSEEYNYSSINGVVCGVLRT